MALTRDQLLAINAAFSSDAGVAVPQDMQEAQANPLLHLARAATGNSPPVDGGNAPPLGPSLGASMPAVGEGVLPSNPSQSGLAPDIHPLLRDKLFPYFEAQSAQNARISQDARAFVGPNGPIGATYLDSLDKIKQAGDLTQAAEQKQAAGLADAHGRDAERIAQDTRSDEQRMRLRDKMTQDYQRKADVLAEQAQNAEVRSFWADKSTGSRILGILAQTLSGAANGLAGNPGAPSALDRIIDHDLEVQKANLQNKRLAADHALNALGQVYRGFESQDSSIAAYRQAAAKWVQSKSNQLAAQLQGDTAPARNQMVQANQEKVVADSQAALGQHAADAADLLHRSADDNLAQLARDESNEKQLESTKGDQLVEVPGVSIPIRKALANPALQKRFENFSDVLGQYDNVEHLVNKPGFSLTDKAQVDAANSLIEGANRQILGTGANLSKQEAESLRNLSVSYLRSKGANSLSELSLPEYKSYIHSMRRAVATTLRSRIRTLGVGADLARHPGFESAYDSLREDQ